MKIPVSKNLSLDASDIVGCLEIPDDMSNHIAGCFSLGRGFKLDACVHAETNKLACVSISPIEVASSIQMSIPTEVHRLEIFDGTTVKMLEQLNETLRLLLECQPLLQMCEKEVSISPHEEAKQAVLASIAMLLSPRFEISEQGQ